MASLPTSSPTIRLEGGPADGHVRVLTARATSIAWPMLIAGRWFSIRYVDSGRVNELGAQIWVMQEQPDPPGYAFAAMSDLDICPLCKLPIEPGQGYHSRAMAHYDCFAGTEDGQREIRLLALIRDGRQATRSREQRESDEEESLEQARTGRGETYLARAAGGHLVHLVDAGTGVSLCGHRPTNKGHNRTKARAKWVPQGSVTPFYRRPCDKCKQFGEIPWQPRPKDGSPPVGDDPVASGE